MRGLLWLMAGIAAGAYGYRYYEQNGGRLPIFEQLMGRRTDEIAADAEHALHSTGHKAQQAISETTANVARETVAAVAEEVADAERAKRREQARGQS